MGEIVVMLVEWLDRLGIKRRARQVVDALLDGLDRNHSVQQLAEDDGFLSELRNHLEFLDETRLRKKNPLAFRPTRAIERARYETTELEVKLHLLREGADPDEAARIRGEIEELLPVVHRALEDAREALG